MGNQEYKLMETNPDGINVTFPIINVDTYDDACEVIKEFEKLRSKHKMGASQN